MAAWGIGPGLSRGVGEINNALLGVSQIQANQATQDRESQKLGMEKELQGYKVQQIREELSKLKDENAPVNFDVLKGMATDPYTQRYGEELAAGKLKTDPETGIRTMRAGDFNTLAQEIKQNPDKLARWKIGAVEDEIAKVDTDLKDPSKAYQYDELSRNKAELVKKKVLFESQDYALRKLKAEETAAEASKTRAEALLKRDEGKSIKPPGSLAEFEEAYKNKGGDISKIKGTPEYEKEWQTWKKSTLTPAAQVNVQYAAPKAEATATGTEKGKSESPVAFNSWSPQAKQQAYWESVITNQDPASVKGLGGNDRQSYSKGFTQWKVDNAITPGMVARMRADYKADDKSLSNQRKNYDMMNGFVINLDSQLAKVKEMYAKLPRLNPKLANIPIVELRKRVTGSGEEAATKAYLIEISNEAGKLSTGSSASIRELSESAQKQWKDIHDEKLSFNDMLKVLNATHDLGHQRIQSTIKAMSMTQDQISAMGTGGTGAGTSGDQNTSRPLPVFK